MRGCPAVGCTEPPLRPLGQQLKGPRAGLSLLCSPTPVPTRARLGCPRPRSPPGPGGPASQAPSCHHLGRPDQAGGEDPAENPGGEAGAHEGVRVCWGEVGQETVGAPWSGFWGGQDGWDWWLLSTPHPLHKQ